jgi:hypothetical protein
MSDTLSENDTRYLTQEEDNEVMNYEELETEEFETETLIEPTKSLPSLNKYRNNLIPIIY